MPKIPWFGTTRERGWMDGVRNRAKAAFEPASLSAGHGLAHSVEDQSAQGIQELPGGLGRLSSHWIQGDIQSPLFPESFEEVVGPAPRESKQASAPSSSTTKARFSGVPAVP